MSVEWYYDAVAFERFEASEQERQSAAASAKAQPARPRTMG